ncbi:MAG: hypothetical protein MPJ50_06580 [Pirellulales bacterium]|nr:hypothetical protein [Pirellulales bacterium]
MKAKPRIEHALWLCFGLLLAFAAGDFLLSDKSGAASTGDRSKDVIMCTGPIDSDGEGIFILDTVTGDLKGWVLDSRSGKFTTGYAINVLEPLGINLNSNPDFSMVTGHQTFRPSRGQSQSASMVIYIAESTTGNVAAFGVPWTSNRRSNATAPSAATFQVLDSATFRAQGIIR